MSFERETGLFREGAVRRETLAASVFNLGSFFPPYIVAEPGRAKRKVLFSPARVQPPYRAGGKESSGTEL